MKTWIFNLSRYCSHKPTVTSRYTGDICSPTLNIRQLSLYSLKNENLHGIVTVRYSMQFYSCSRQAVPGDNYPKRMVTGIPYTLGFNGGVNPVSWTKYSRNFNERRSLASVQSSLTPPRYVHINQRVALSIKGGTSTRTLTGRTNHKDSPHLWKHRRFRNVFTVSRSSK